MKRIILICFIGVLSINTFGQIKAGGIRVNDMEKKAHMYIFQATRFYNYLFSDDGFQTTYFRISYNNGKNELYYYNLRNNIESYPSGLWGADYKIERTYSFDCFLDQLYSDLNIYYEFNDKKEFGNGTSHTLTHKHLVRLNICQLESYSTSEKKSGTLGGLDCSIALNNSYRILPLHYIHTDIINGNLNTALPIDDKINIYDKEGFSSDIYSFQYSLDPADEANWKFIDKSLSVLNKLSVSAQDILGNEVDKFIGKHIYIRTVSCPNGDGTYATWSNTIPLTVIPSAPHIVSHNTTPTKCFNSSDGSVTINFDRKLYPNEKLILYWNGVNEAKNITIDTITNNVYNITIHDLPTGKHNVSFRGEYVYNNGTDTINTYTDGTSHKLTFEIIKPTPVTFTTSKTDVNCYGGSDGSITLSATGGQGVYKYSIDNGSTWIDFNKGASHTLSSLRSGNYSFQVQDTNGCVARDTVSQEITKINVQIKQPEAPFEVKEIGIVSPTGYGLSNGYVFMTVGGGTPNSQGAYAFEWRKDTPDGAVINSGIITQVDPVNKTYTIKLDQIPSGKYYLSVTDQNYLNAKDSISNCGILFYEFTVTQPLPLIAEISLEKCISCNIANEYEHKVDNNGNGVPDESEDAVVKANVRGGVLPYKFQWQIKNGTTYNDIPLASDSLLSGLTQGIYKVLITDKNGNITQTELEVVYPTQLKINLSANTIKCNDMSSGEVSVVAAGGRGGYTYKWNTMDTTAVVTGLSAGNYFVLVQDSAKCTIKGNIVIEQPGQLSITDVSVANPKCFGSSSGLISIKASGGQQPYAITWSNGMSGESITGLKADVYTVNFTDANGCSMSKEYILTDPEKFVISLGEDITLCAGDSQTYNLTIDDPNARYRWTDGTGGVISESPVISLSDVGTYTASVTTSAGCVATDDVIISRSNEVLSPEFMVATHAYTYRNVILVNTSPIKPQKVEWVIPNNNFIQVINKNEESVDLIFTQKGNYKIGLRGYQGACDKVFFKEITVEDNIYGVEDTPSAISNIKKFIIAPNPNNGRYNVVVELYKEASIKLRILTVMSNDACPLVNMPVSNAFTIPFNLTLLKGMYLVVLQTGSEVQVKKMIVQ